MQSIVSLKQNYGARPVLGRGTREITLPRPQRRSRARAGRPAPPLVRHLLDRPTSQNNSTSHQQFLDAYNTIITSSEGCGAKCTPTYLSSPKGGCSPPRLPLPAARPPPRPSVSATQGRGWSARSRDRRPALCRNSPPAAMSTQSFAC